MAFYRSLKQGLRFGWTSGLLLGSFDACARYLSGRYEWYELYLALLLPALVLAVFFTALCFLKQILIGRVKTLSFCWLVLIAAIWMLAAGLSLQLAEKTDSATANLVGIGVLLLAILILASKSDVRAYIIAFFNRPFFHKPIEAFRFLASFLVVFCLVYDLITLSFPDYHHKQSPPAQSPNILFITLDTVRARSLTPYNSDLLSSPFLNKLAARSVVFDSATAPSSWTLPSHASMFTGKLPTQHGAHYHHQLLLQESQTLAEALQEIGYDTAGIVAGPYVKARYGIAQGFRFYHDRLDFFEYFTLNERFSIRRLLEYLLPGFTKSVLHADGELIAEEVNSLALNWLDGVGETPFFLFLNYFDAHDPYNLGKQYREMFVSEERSDLEIYELFNRIQYSSKWSFEKYPIDPATAQYITGTYHAEIFHLDKYIQRLFEALETRGLLQNTLVVITSDHGEEFFEHGGIQHGQTLYEEVTHVPLLVYQQDYLEPTRIPESVGLSSLYSTLLQAVDGEARSASLWDRIIGNDTAQQAPAIAELMGNPMVGGNLNMRSIRVGDLKRIEVQNPKPRIPDALYNLEQDPLEIENQIDNYPELAEDLSSQIDHFLGNGR